MRLELPRRDDELIRGIGDWSQLATTHIKALYFPNVNRISMDRTLKRLRAEKYVRRVGVRAVGHQGGTAPGVYELGPKGFWWVKREPKKVHRIAEHSLHVADMSVALIEAHRRGEIIIETHELEKVVDNMRVDMYVDFKVPAIRKLRHYYIELQEHARPDLIKPKLEHHYDAYRAYAGERNYPEVALVARDEYIKSAISKLVPANMKRLVSVYTIEEFLAKATSLTPQ